MFVRSRTFSGRDRFQAVLAHFSGRDPDATSSFSDSLTLQLWKDRSDAERNPPTKGSIALEGYLGWEAGFTLDRESLTLALVLGDAAMVTLAFDARETMMRWQVRYGIPPSNITLPPQSSFT